MLSSHMAVRAMSRRLPLPSLDEGLHALGEEAAAAAAAVAASSSSAMENECSLLLEQVTSIIVAVL